MSRVTRFAAADPRPAARVSGFMAHLRDHGFRLGVAETETALRALSCVNAARPSDARLALKSICAGSHEDIAQFDLLFDAFWMTGGRVRQKVVPSGLTKPPQNARNTRSDDTQTSPAKAPFTRPRTGTMALTAMPRARANWSHPRRPT